MIIRNGNNDEIDYKFLLLKIIKSKFLLIFTTLIFVLIPVTYHLLAGEKYYLELKVQLGSKENPSAVCSSDTFGIYHCKKLGKTYSDLYTPQVLKKITDELVIRSNKLNVDFLFNINETKSINILLSSRDLKNIENIQNNIDNVFKEEDFNIIQLVIINRSSYHRALEIFEKSFTLESDEADTGLLAAIEITINNIKNLTNEETFIMSKTLTTKNLYTKSIELNHILAFLILGLIVSLVIILSRKDNTS